MIAWASIPTLSCQAATLDGFPLGSNRDIVRHLPSRTSNPAKKKVPSLALSGGIRDLDHRIYSVVSVHVFHLHLVINHPT